VRRLEHAADLMQRAIDAGDDDNAAREALAELFWDYVEPPKGSTSKAAYVAAARKGETFSVRGGTLAIGAEAGTRSLKQTRSYGDAPQP
jgi:hypothetical protein